MRIPVVAVLGPTASGKSALALDLAERFGGEIVSADSAQVYRGVDVGTAKPGAGERARVAHHLVDLRDLGEDFSLADFQREASAALRDIRARGRLPLLVGGTGLYVRGLLEGYTLVECPPDPALRRELEGRPTADLVQELRSRDPVSAERIDPRNRRRLVRALEVCRQAGRPFSEMSRRRPTEFRPLKLGLRMDWGRLGQRIDRRVDEMIREKGWLEEVQGLVENGFAPHLRRLRILGYSDLLDVLEGLASLPEATERIRRATRRYARRQRTWLRAEPAVEWIDLDLEVDPLGVAERRIRRFLEETQRPGEREPPCS